MCKQYEKGVAMRERQTGRRWDAWKTQEVKVHGMTQTLFHNNRYHVFLHMYKNENPAYPHDIIHLSIRNNDRSARRDWRDFQRIKNEIVGEQVEMVELYPKEGQKVDISNQYHLWGYNTTDATFTASGIGWNEGKKVWNGKSERPAIPGTENAVQRPSEEESTL
jgi:hypothetical protein